MIGMNWNSGSQGQIEDMFWETLKKNPSNFLIEDLPDDTKLREQYKLIARSQGVRIY